MRVREATEADFDEIARLTVAAYRALDTWVGDDYAVHLADVATRAEAENTSVLVAEDDIPAGAAATAAVVAGGQGAAARTPERRILGSVTLTLGGQRPERRDGEAEDLPVGWVAEGRAAGHGALVFPPDAGA